jgi:hypothetical protein
VTAPWAQQIVGRSGVYTARTLDDVKDAVRGILFLVHNGEGQPIPLLDSRLLAELFRELLVAIAVSDESTSDVSAPAKRSGSRARPRKPQSRLSVRLPDPRRAGRADRAGIHR